MSRTHRRYCPKLAAACRRQADNGDWWDAQRGPVERSPFLTGRDGLRTAIKASAKDGRLDTWDEIGGNHLAKRLVKRYTSKQLRQWSRSLLDAEFEGLLETIEMTKRAKFGV